MRVKNTTPFLAGWKVTSRRPPQPEMTLVVRAAFALSPGEPLVPTDDQGALTAEIFHPEDEERRGACLYPGDFADFKLNAEVMLHGTCHPPGGKKVTECPVRFAVGSWSKRLRVVGRRVWSDRSGSAACSDPLPFTAMGLGYSESFGGRGFARNPVGKGYETAELPCIEHPKAPVQRRDDRVEPTGFGPLNPVWPQRAARFGKEYGAAYRKTRAPYYSVDFDWKYFHAAPADQQLEGYLRGDEKLVFQNLHPAAETLTTSLPGLRIRAFVLDVRKRFREVPMNLDTLFADLDSGAVYLTWRGLDAVADADLADVDVIRVASEELRAPAQELEHYRAETAAFAADPLGFGDAFPKELVALAERSAAEDEVPPPRRPVPPAERIPQLIGSFVSRLRGKTPAELDAMMNRLGVPAETGGLRSALLRSVSARGTAPPLVPLKPGAPPCIKMGPAVRDMLSQVDRVKKTAAASGKEVRGVEAVDAFVTDPRLTQIDPTYKPPRPDSPAPEAPGPGRDLSGQDFTDRDLRGIDLTGANLEGAIFTRADLTGALLTRTNLKYAVLYESKLTSADLGGADLTLAHVGHASARGASFREAILEQASFDSADLAGCTLEGARGQYVRFSRADLGRAQAKGAKLARAHFDSAILERADFSDCDLTCCLFGEARAQEIVLARSILLHASFEDADLSGAILADAWGDRTSWIRAKLDRADARHVGMLAAMFIEVSAAGTSFLEANLRDARFYRAMLDGAAFVRANLFGADFSKASLHKVSFAEANLYDAKFLGSAGAGCDFSGANLKRSTLESQA